MGIEKTLLYGPGQTETLRTGPLMTTVRGERNWGRDFWEIGGANEHQMDPDTLLPIPVQGSTNIRLHRATIWLWWSHHFGGPADLAAAWHAVEGMLRDVVWQGNEPLAGGQYGIWNAWDLRAIHALAILRSHPLEPQLAAYEKQTIGAYALVTQPGPATEATDWETPFGEHREPKVGGTWSTTATHTRSYVDPSRSFPPKDIYFNLVGYGDMFRRLVTGKGQADGSFDAEMHAALESVRADLGHPFAGGATEAAVLDCVERGELGPLASWFSFPVATRFRFVRFEDESVLSYGESSTNGGSTYFNGACYQDAHGGREWTGGLRHPGRRKNGRHVETELEGTTVRSWQPDGVAEPEWELEDFSIEVTSAPPIYDILLRKDGRAVDQVGGGIKPPPPSGVVTRDLATEFFVPSIKLIQSQLGNHSYAIIGNRIIWNKGKSGFGTEGMVFDDESIYQLWTPHLAWLDGESYKGQLHGPLTALMAPRYVRYDPSQPPGKLWDHIDGSGYPYQIVEGCEVKQQLNLAGSMFEVWGPYQAGKWPLGGIVPDTCETLVVAHYWGAASFPYPVKEEWIFPLGFGMVLWRRNEWDGQRYVVAAQSSLNNTISGPAVAPQFPCDPRMVDPTFIYPIAA